MLSPHLLSTTMPYPLTHNSGRDVWVEPSNNPNIRAQDNQMDNQIAQQKVALEQQRMEQRATDFQEKIASQERMTAQKIQAARERELLRQRGQ